MYYPEFKKINEYVITSADLLNTSRRLSDIFNFIFKKNLKRIAVTFYNEKGKLKSYKYSQVRSNTYAIAGALNNYMIQQPKNVPIVLKVNNGPHWQELFWAILMCGYKPLLVDAKASKEGTENLIKQGKAVAIVTDDLYTYEVNKISVTELLNEKHHYTFAPNWENEVIFCSSGTTGDVKLMIFNGENIVHQVYDAIDMPKTARYIMYPKKYGQLNILAMIPFHHIFGFTAVFLWYTYYGCNLVFPSSNSPTEIQKICQKAHVSHVYSVPLFWDSLAQSIQRKFALLDEDKQALLDKMIGFNTGKLTKAQAGIAATDIAIRKVQNLLLGSDIKFCISGGGFLSNETLTIINGIGYPLYNGFGMTEVGVTSVELDPDVVVRLKGSVGKPLKEMVYKIDKPNKKTGQGELLIKSPTIHVREIIGGVEKDTELDADGFLHTGDIGEIDSQGSAYIRGRIKDIIINADGENIFPDELEIFFKTLPHVTHLCVLGVKNGKGAHEEDIVLVLEIDNSTSEEELNVVKEKIKEIVPTLPHKVVISQIYLARGKLPLANNMKVKRYLLKKGIEAKSKEYIPIDNKRKTKTFEGFDKETIESILVPTRKIFSEVLILPEFKIDDDSHWINDLGGDSMSYVELVQKLQEKFNITLPEEKLGQLTCVNDFVYEIAVILKGQNK